MAKQKITVDGISIRINDLDYISITDIAKKSSANKPAVTIQSWLRNQRTISFLATWEQVHNPNFKVSQMTDFREQAADNRSAITPKQYIEQTGAIGITAKSGRYGGTYTHSDIALNFCYWLSPEFQVYLAKEFERLKRDEARRLGIEFDFKRELTRINYPLHTEAIKTHLLSKGKSTGIIYASEADLLNIAVFGKTAKQWRTANPDLKGNVRDYASIEELMALSNIEYLNAKLIQWGFNINQREETLTEAAQELFAVYKKTKAVERIKKKVKKIG